MKPKLRFTILFGDPLKEKFENVKPASALNDSGLIKGNSKYVAVSWASSGGGALAILNAAKPSRLETSFPMIRGHNGAVLDFDFYPFNEDFIATSSEDCSVKLWKIPEEFKEDLNTPVATLNGHLKKSNLIQFHPSAESIIASSSYDNTVKIWNIENQSCINTLNANDSFMSIDWNLGGNLLGTASRDKMLRIADPRAGNWVHEFKGHEGPKGQKFCWLGNSNYVFSVGFSKTYERQFYLWDINKLSEPVQQASIDQQAGVLFPFFDADTNVLYLGGKGDGNIRYYEFAEGQIYNLNQFSSTTPAKGLGFLPKRCVDVKRNELARCLKLTTTTIEYVTFCALKKTNLFSEELYPDCLSEEPSLKAEEWVNGKNAEPKRRSMKPELAGNVKSNATINVVSSDNTTSTSNTQTTQASQKVDETAELKEKIKLLENRLDDTENYISKLKIENDDLVSQLQAVKNENEELRRQLQGQPQENPVESQPVEGEIQE